MTEMREGEDGGRSSDFPCQPTGSFGSGRGEGGIVIG